MRKKTATRIRSLLILLTLALGAQSATWGQWEVSCEFSGDWTNPLVWGLQPPCYPDAGICSESTWLVTIEPSCFVNLNTSPSVAGLTLNGVLFANAASISVSGTTTMNDNTSFNSSGAFQNDGDFHKVGAGTSSTISAAFNSPGTVDIESGTLRLIGGGVASNVVSVRSGAVLEFGGPFEMAGNLVGDGTVRIDNHLNVVDSTGSWNAGFEILAGGIHFSATGRPTSAAMSFGTLTGNVVIEGHLDWTGGTMKAPGTTWINATADVIDAPSNPKLDGRSLVVNTGGTLALLGPGNDLWGVNGASVLNRGTVKVFDGIPLFANALGDASFVNDGLFMKSGPNTALVQFAFVNYDMVHVTEAELEFTHDYVQLVNPSTLKVPVTQLSGALIGDTGALVDIREGVLQGYGAVEAAVLSTGVISPGIESIDVLTFEDTLTLGPGSALEFDLGGAMGEGEAAHDAIVVLGSLVLDGDLLVTFVNGFENVVHPGDTLDLITVLSENEIQGQLVGQANGSQLLTADGLGSFTVEYGPGAAAPHLLRLTNYQSVTPNPAGSVPDGGDLPGVPLLVEKATGTEIALTWGSSCASGDTDYEIYQGLVGDYDSHVKLDPCSTGGAVSATFVPPPLVSTYYLVVPTNGTNEGSYGLRSDGTERPGPQHPVNRCRPQQIVAVCQ